MNLDDPTDIAPLSYGAGLTLGLMLIIGLPSEKKPAKAGTPPLRAACEPKLAENAPTSVTVPASLRL